MTRLDKNPNLNAVFAHFMYVNLRPELAEELVNKYPNLKFDLAPGWEIYVGFAKQYKKWRAFFEKYSDRIFYGTDTSYTPINKKIYETVSYAIEGSSDEIYMPLVPFAKMQSFALSEEAKENIFHRNYAALIGNPKPVNVPLVIRESENLIGILSRNGVEQGAVSRLEYILKELSHN